MASSISAGTTSATALVHTADTTGSLVLQTNNGTTALTLSTAQVATFAGTAILPTTLGVGSATPATSGAGITFPATQSASSNANTLDDYEEGTWTPIVTPGGGSITSYTAAGTYTKIGSSVLLTMRILLSNVGSASSYMAITGLPFTSASTSMQMVMFVREGNVTGQTYQFFINNASTNGTVQTLSGGDPSWTNNYNYAAMGVYPASS